MFLILSVKFRYLRLDSRHVVQKTNIITFYLRSYRPQWATTISWIQIIEVLFIRTERETIFVPYLYRKMDGIFAKRVLCGLSITSPSCHDQRMNQYAVPNSALILLDRVNFTYSSMQKAVMNVIKRILYPSVLLGVHPITGQKMYFLSMKFQYSAPNSSPQNSHALRENNLREKLLADDVFLWKWMNF